MKRSSYEHTPDQLAQAEQKRLRRREKKQKQQQESLAKPEQPSTSPILSRPWISLADPNQHHTQAIKVMTWNLLAQCLVRSELFPTSGKARKANDREPMIHAEILSYDADILCMQEVDRLDKLLPMLDLAGYAYSYASGPDKPHGCLIAYKQNIFQKVYQTTIEYDKLAVRNDPELSSPARIGSSHQTKNIANIVALQNLGPNSDLKGYLVVTTHLFWHPAYTYERARQAGLLLREVVAFQQSKKLHDWPCIIAGDFNFAPDDPAYSLLIGEPLSSEQRERLQTSRVVHMSIDPTVPITVVKDVDEGGGEEKADPDRVIRNSREAKPSDGLLSDTELSNLVQRQLRSAYDEIQRKSLQAGFSVATFGARKSLPMGSAGACEPMWTSYTHYWKTTLDYIFILDAPGNSTSVTGYLQPHRTEDVAQGLPQIGVCGSDHFSLCVEVGTSPNTLESSVTAKSAIN